MNSISTGESTLIVYEAETEHGALNIDIVKKMLQSFNLDIGFKEVKQNWTDELNGSVNRLVFIVSADTYFCEIKRKISKFSERNSNAASRTAIEILAIIEDDDDGGDDDDLGFDYEEDKEDNTIEVKKLNQVYEWWPFVLQFLQPKKSLFDHKVSDRKHTCFFLFNEDCRMEAEWFKNHRDTLEKLWIRCLRREGNSKVTEDIYMKSSCCVVVYVNGNTDIDDLKDKVRKAVASGCKIRLFLETANFTYADTVQYDCHLTLSGTTVYAHWASLMKDLNISKYYTTAVNVFVALPEM